MTQHANHLIDAEADLRVQKSKEALFGAFMELVQGQAYSTITIQQIIQRADVARSTFYEHFKNKDDILISSMAGPFFILRQNAVNQSTLTTTIPLLEHFWQKRSLARILFTSAMQTKLINLWISNKYSE